MANPILMPALSPTMEEGTLAKWLKKEGDTISSGDIIAEIETDKATMEVEAVDEGVLAKILVADGTEGVKVNTVIAVIAEEGDSEADIEAAASSVTSAASQVETPKEAAPVTEVAANTPAAPAAASTKTDRIFASPLARRIASNEGLALENITGTGPHGRIIKRDVEAALASPKAAVAIEAAAAAVAAAGNDVNLPSDLPFEDIPSSSIRKVIATRLVQSKQEVPHYYVSMDCELDALLDLRKTLNNQAEDGAYKLSVNDMIIKATALALREVPDMNVAWGGDIIRRFDQVDMAVAVSIEGGLVTPIIKNAGNKGLATISSEMKDLAKRAREGALAPSEYQGGTFTISNLGMFGVNNFTAIVNQPAAGILAIGAGEKKPVVKNDALAIATVMTVTLSADHRTTDGAVGALFVKSFKKYIENPLMMML